VSGFVGLVSADGAPVDEALLGRVTEAMAYCGPDHRATWTGEGIGLGHALFGHTPDPPAADRQPWSLDDRTWIAADARVDGRSELVAALRGQGREVGRDAPDAHLILLAYDAWGERCLEHLIGDFAFAIWDGANRRLFCARDHFGMIPFYYARPAAGGVVFGNVIPALQLHPGVSGRLNERAIGDFLLFDGNMDLASTTFADLHALPPAHALTWERGRLRLHRYWTAEDRDNHPSRQKDETERFRDLFDQAVGDRLRSPRAGSHLSGGMDSTSVAVTAHEILRSRGSDFDLRAYTMVSEGVFAEEEGRFARMVAERSGLPLESLVVDPFVTGEREWTGTWTAPEPGPWLGLQADLELAQGVCAFARTLLSGLGGDPLFVAGPPATWGGSARWAWANLRRRRLPRPGIRTALRRRIRRAGVSATRAPDWIQPSFANRIDLRGRLREVEAEWDAPTGPRAMLHPIWPNRFAWGHPGASGLPLRTLYPFFDVRLAEYVWELPSHPWRLDKRVLREAMRGRLPQAVLERPKTPLYIPRGRRDTQDPRYRLAHLPKIRQMRSELMSARGLEEYVVVDRLRELIESPSPGPRIYLLDNCFNLARWLGSTAP
jgi:asparagine synthase (glutamine-hydrolysing)